MNSPGSTITITNPTHPVSYYLTRYPGKKLITDWDGKITTPGALHIRKKKHKTQLFLHNYVYIKNNFPILHACLTDKATTTGTATCSDSKGKQS